MKITLNDFRDTVFSIKIVTPEHRIPEEKMPPSVSTLSLITFR